MVTKVFLHPPAGVVSVSVRDDRQVNRTPRINIKFSLRTIDTFIGESNEFQKRDNWLVLIIQKTDQNILVFDICENQLKSKLISFFQNVIT